MAPCITYVICYYKLTGRGFGAEPAKLKKAAGNRVVEAISRVEQGKVKKVAGYDGEYGKILIFSEKEKKAEIEEGQKTLGEF